MLARQSAGLPPAAELLCSSGPGRARARILPWEGWGALGTAGSPSVCFQLFPERVYLHGAVSLHYRRSAAFFPIIWYFLVAADLPQPVAGAYPALTAQINPPCRSLLRAGTPTLDAGPGVRQAGTAMGWSQCAGASVATAPVVPCHATRATAALLPGQGGMHPHRERGAIAARVAPADPELSATVCCRCLKAGRTRRHLSGTVLVRGGSAAHQLGDAGLRVGGYNST